MPVTGSASQTGSYHQNETKNIVEEKKDREDREADHRRQEQQSCRHFGSKGRLQKSLGPSHESDPKGKLSQTFHDIVFGSMCFFFFSS